MKTYMKRHNNKILKRHDSQDNPPNTNSTHICNCRNPMQCPVKGNCLQSSVLYEARVTTTDRKQTRTYIGVTGDNFKTRYRNHCKSLNNRKYKNETELSKHVWNLKDNKREYTIAWDIIRQIATRGTGPRKCRRLCLEGKLLILKGRRKNILNKRSELFNKCRHVNKHLTWAYVTCK